MASWGVAFWSHAVIRTRFFADYLIKAAGDGIRQLVLLAAGLDTRAFRLPWPDGVRLYELDLREVLRFKDRVLAARTVIARCERTVVPVDLREDWPGVLIDAGLQTGEPTAWLAEGLVIYLTAAETVDLLTRLGQLSAASSSLAFELENLGTDAMRTRAQQAPERHQYARLWTGGLPDAPQLAGRARLAVDRPEPRSGRRGLRTPRGCIVHRRLRRCHPRLIGSALGTSASRSGCGQRLGSSSLSRTSQLAANT